MRYSNRGILNKNRPLVQVYFDSNVPLGFSKAMPKIVDSAPLTFGMIHMTTINKKGQNHQEPKILWKSGFRKLADGMFLHHKSYSVFFSFTVMRNNSFC